MGVQTRAVASVSNLLLSWAALTPSVLRLLPSIAWYDRRSTICPLAQIPEVYEGRKNSSAIKRVSTPSQKGKLPSTLRVPGRDVIPPAKVRCLLKV